MIIALIKHAHAWTKYLIAKNWNINLVIFIIRLVNIKKIHLRNKKCK